MIENSISKRYARALISVAQDLSPDKVDGFGRALEAFSDACKTNAELLPVLSNRHFDLGARDRIVDQLSAKLGFETPVKNFLKLLVHKGRIALFEVVRAEYQALANEFMRREVMTVVSAADLSEAQYGQLQELFGKMTGKTMVLKRKTLSKVLGGVRVHIKDKVYDYTIQNQLEQMKHRLMG